MRKKLLLVNPTHKEIPNASQIKYYDMPPMGLGYLAALTPEDSWDITLVDENYDVLDFDMNPDLVGISSLTFNCNRAYEVGEAFRSKGSKVVYGGIHPSMLPQEALQFGDSVVIGEGENVWGNVLEDFDQGALKKTYTGTPADMDNLIIPRRDLFMHKIERHGILTSRGCPLDCEFCSVTAFNKAKYRKRPLDQVLDELETIPSRFVVFMDDNFGGLTPRHLQGTKELLKGMIDRKIKLNWGTQTGLNYADDDELLRLTRKSGGMVLFLGIESVSESSLEGAAKKGNIVRNVKRAKEAIKRLHDNGIAVAGSFILGHDGDDKDIFDRLIEFVFETKMDTCALGISTPYPGTRLFNRIKEDGRLLCNNFPQDWIKFNIMNVTFQPKNMTVDELHEGFTRLIKETTNLRASFKRAWDTLLMSKSITSVIPTFCWNRGFFKHIDIHNRIRINRDLQES